MRRLHQASQLAGGDKGYIARRFPAHDDDLLLIDYVVEDARQVLPQVSVRRVHVS